MNDVEKKQVPSILFSKIDIAALREALKTCDRNDYRTWPQLPPQRLEALLDALEVERKRAESLSKSEWKMADELSEAQAELAALKGEQVPVVYCQTTRDKIKHVAMQALSHALKNKQLEMADIHALTMMLMPLLTAPQKPVVLPKSFAMAKLGPNVPEIKCYSAQSVIAAIEAAGCTVTTSNNPLMQDMNRCVEKREDTGIGPHSLCAFRSSLGYPDSGECVQDAPGAAAGHTTETTGPGGGLSPAGILHAGSDYGTWCQTLEAKLKTLRDFYKGADKKDIQ